MQFSLRRMLLAVAVCAATLGISTLYARRVGVFCSRSDLVLWWVAAATTALGMGSLMLVGQRRDLGRIVNASLWTIAGFIAAAMLNDHQALDHAVFVLAGWIPGLVGGCILGGLIGGVIGCILFHWLRPPPAPLSH